METKKSGIKSYVRNKKVDTGEILKVSGRLSSQRTTRGSITKDQIVLSINHTGGTKPYYVQYKLYRDGNLIQKTGGTGETNVYATTSFLDFIAGDYTLQYTVTDANGNEISGETSATFETVL